MGPREPRWNQNSGSGAAPVAQGPYSSFNLIAEVTEYWYSSFHASRLTRLVRTPQHGSSVALFCSSSEPRGGDALVSAQPAEAHHYDARRSNAATATGPGARNPSRPASSRAPTGLPAHCGHGREEGRRVVPTAQGSRAAPGLRGQRRGRECACGPAPGKRRGARSASEEIQGTRLYLGSCANDLCRKMCAALVGRRGQELGYLAHFGFASQVLAADDPEAEIQFWINSPGGSVRCVRLVIACREKQEKRSLSGLLDVSQ
eukprot:scaffold6348_cov259-Pinguiococcus_pyrenoidosus.AAC.12